MTHNMTELNWEAFRTQVPQETDLVIVPIGTIEAHAPLAHDYDVVCAFVHDELDEKVLRGLATGGTRLVALRAAGFNNVDLEVARELGRKDGLSGDSTDEESEEMGIDPGSGRSGGHEHVVPERCVAGPSKCSRRRRISLRGGRYV